jgi:hypothetical protein
MSAHPAKTSARNDIRLTTATSCWTKDNACARNSRPTVRRTTATSSCEPRAKPTTCSIPRLARAAISECGRGEVVSTVICVASLSTCHALLLRAEGRTQQVRSPATGPSRVAPTCVLARATVLPNSVGAQRGGNRGLTGLGGFSPAEALPNNKHVIAEPSHVPSSRDLPWRSGYDGMLGLSSHRTMVLRVASDRLYVS